MLMLALVLCYILLVLFCVALLFCYVLFCVGFRGFGVGIPMHVKFYIPIKVFSDRRWIEGRNKLFALKAIR